MLGRQHGLAADWLIAARIVLADGRTIECDEHHDTGLFWALRGAGAGNFGVVTELTFRTLRVPEVVTTFNVIWPFADASRVVQSWLSWVSLMPDEISASLALRASGNLDEPPSVELYGAMLGTRSDAAALLEGVTGRAGSYPASSHLRQGSYLDALHYWAERAGEQLENPRMGSGIRQHGAIKSEFFAQTLPPDAVAAIVENFGKGRVAGESRNVDFSPWGGAYNRVPAHATAFVHRDALFWVKHTVAVAADSLSEGKQSAHRWINRSWQAVRPYGTGLVFPNFPDPDLEDWGRAYYGSNYRRLLETKAQYDPDNLFNFHQSLPVA
jgi:FAD/FMN-containing dehydrogenase